MNDNKLNDICQSISFIKPLYRGVNPFGFWYAAIRLAKVVKNACFYCYCGRYKILETLLLRLFVIFNC